MDARRLPNRRRILFWDRSAEIRFPKNFNKLNENKFEFNQSKRIHFGFATLLIENVFGGASDLKAF